MLAELTEREGVREGGREGVREAMVPLTCCGVIILQRTACSKCGSTLDDVWSTPRIRDVWRWAAAGGGGRLCPVVEG